MPHLLQAALTRGARSRSRLGLGPCLSDLNSRVTQDAPNDGILLLDSRQACPPLQEPRYGLYRREHEEKDLSKEAPHLQALRSVL
jgi:hypothetical protein